MGLGPSLDLAKLPSLLRLPLSGYMVIPIPDHSRMLSMRPLLTPLPSTVREFNRMDRQKEKEKKDGP